MFKSSCYALLALLAATAAQGAQPSLVSVNPSSGSGSSQRFSFTVSDSAGYQDISGMNVLFNSSFTGTNGCWTFLDRPGNTLWLASADTSAWNSAVLGSSTTLTNGICSILASTASVTQAGNNVTLTMTIAFDSSFAGSQTIFMRAGSNEGEDTGYQPEGAFDVTASGAAPDFSVSPTSTSASVPSGGSAGYIFNVISANGFTGTVSYTASSQTAGLTTNFDPVSSVSVPPGGSARVGLGVQTSSSTPAGTATIIVNFTSGTLSHSVQVSLVVGGANPTISVSPSSGSSGLGQTFVVNASDPDGWQDIKWFSILINSSLSGANACWLNFQSNQSGSTTGPLSMANDDASSWTSIQISPGGGVTNTVSNSQCSWNGGSTTISLNNETGLKLTLPLQFTSAFAGQKTIFLDAVDSEGHDTGWVNGGSWTINAGAGGPDFTMTVSPTTMTLSDQSSGNYAVNVQALNGFASDVQFSATGQPADVQALGGTIFRGSGSGTVYVDTSNSTSVGTYTLTITATGGGVTHTAQVTLNLHAVTAPTSAVSPSSGSGSSQSFTFTFSDPDGYQNIKNYSILINSSFDGANACWIYGQGQGITLASDDESIWSATSSENGATVQNSQCSISGSTLTIDGSGTDLKVTMTINFMPGFAGNKTIYLRAANFQNADSGYLPEGTWNVP